MCSRFAKTSRAESLWQNNSRKIRALRWASRKLVENLYSKQFPGQHVNPAVLAPQSSLRPRGTWWFASAPPARYWSGADRVQMPETAPTGKLLLAALRPRSGGLRPPEEPRYHSKQ